MAHAIRETRYVRDAADPVDARYGGISMAARIINLVGNTLVGLITLRFVLVLLGANSTNAFVNFIYSITYPSVAPFFGIFNYTVNYGVSRFEFESLIAIAVYALVTWFLVRLLSPREPVEY